MAEANRDEAARCGELSRRFFGERDLPLAVKYAEKAVRLFATEEAQAWLARMNDCAAVEQRPSPASTTASATEGSKASEREPPSARNREQAAPRSEARASFTREQAQEVARLLKVDRNDYYAVLGVARGADDAEIKRAYRKLALQFHPDKNQAPGADEAFKAVSRAFSCLADGEKKQHYDRFGAEDAVGTTPGGVRFRRPAGRAPHGHYEAEVSPEELFNMFFGNFTDGVGVQFNGASAFGPMFMHTFHSGRGAQRTRPRKPDPPITWVAVALQIVPLLLVAIIMFFSNFSSLSSSPSHSTASRSSWEAVARHVSLAQGRTHPHPFTTAGRQIAYYGSDDYHSYFSGARRSKGLQREMQTFEEAVERQYVAELQRACQEEERGLQLQRAQAASDPAELERLQRTQGPSCERLHALGLPRTQ